MHYCGAGFTVRPSAEGCHVSRPEFSPIGEDGGSATPTSLAPSWRRPWPDPRAKAFCRRRASSGSRADASRSSLKMRWPCGVRTGTTKTELMQRTYQPKRASRNRPQVIAVQEPSIPKAAQYRRRQADVICRCAAPLPRTSHAWRFKASRSARIPIVLAGRFCAGDSRKLKTRKPQRLLVECQGAGTTRSRAERCNDSVGE